MRILITNDDGIESSGLRALADAFASCGNEVTVIAPESQRSACGHGILSTHGIKYSPVKISEAYTAFSCNGTPADCVKLGVLHLLKDKKPELVISGINWGTNLGSDVIYSGTVSAASEGAYQGIRAVAISTNRADYDKHLEEVCDYLLKILPELFSAPLPKSVIFNINYPTTVPFKGTKVVKAGINSYTDAYVANEDDSFYVTLMGKPVKSALTDKETDIEYFEKGYATLTVLDLDRNDYDSIEKMKELLK